MVTKPLGQILKSLGFVRESDIQENLRAQKEKGGALGQLLLQNGLITEDNLNQALAQQRGMDFIDLDKEEIPPEVIDLVDATTVETFMIMPVRYDGTTLTVAIARPDNLNVLDDLRFTLPKHQSGFSALLPGEEHGCERVLRRCRGGRRQGP